MTWNLIGLAHASSAGKHEGGVYLKLRHPVTASRMPLRPPGVERLLPALAKASPRGQAGQLALPFSGQDRENTPCSAVVPCHRGVRRCFSKIAGCSPGVQNNRVYQLQRNPALINMGQQCDSQ
jgi:hypothetical protein